MNLHFVLFIAKTEIMLMIQKMMHWLEQCIFEFHKFVEHRVQANTSQLQTIASPWKYMPCA